ncbi:hypothetical protein ISN72_20460 [Dyella nitratireducens]
MALIVFCALTIAAYTQLTIFVVPPIGAVPEGRTIVMLRLNKTKFIDSPDAMCDRMMSGVSLICRGIAIAAVARNMTVIARLPYSETLYLISTDGKTYSR